MKTGMRKKINYLLPSAGVLLLFGFAAVSQNRANATSTQQDHREDSEQLVQQISQELKTAREQVSKVDTDKDGHKYKLEQLLGQAEREATDLAASLPKKR
jgi:hypothetical protein